MSDVCNDITTESMGTIWDRSPRQFQLDAISNIIKMRCDKFFPQATLLVQGTGGGKSGVYQGIGTVDAGVTIVLENTLSLSSDQLSKISEANEECGPIEAYQLDSIKSQSLRTDFSKHIRSFHSSTNATIFLFSSPEEMQRAPWPNLVASLTLKHVLRLACIDEVHQFVMFGLTFRTSFCALKKSLFKQLIDYKHLNNNPTSMPTHLKVPLLCMTATFDHDLLQLLQRMIGIRFLPSNFFWSGKLGMCKRKIHMQIVSTSQHLRVIKKQLLKHLLNNTTNKCTIYSNTASTVEHLKDSIDIWLDEENKTQGDTLLVNGTLEPELKLRHVQKFTQLTSSDIDEETFHPRILFATASCIGAGLDSSQVINAIRVGLPSSLIDLIQEMGRCGRGRPPTAPNPTDEFVLCLNLNDFTHMIERIFKKEEINSDSSEDTSKSPKPKC